MKRISENMAATLRFSKYDVDGNLIGGHAADFAIRICVFLSFLLFLGYILEAVFLILFSKGNEDDQDLAWTIAPLFSQALVVTSIIFGFIVNPISFFGVLSKNREVVGAAFWFSFLVVTMNLVVFIFLQMRGNGIVVIPSQGNSSLRTFTASSEEGIIRFALENKEKWLNLQSELSDCCGFNFKSLYADELFKIDNFILDDLLSSLQCGVGRTKIDDIKAEFPVFSDAAVAKAEEDEILNSPTFFCEPFIATRIKSIAQNTSIAFGVQVFLQVVLMFFLGQLIYTYTESEGGLRADEDSLEARPKIENTILVKAGYANNPNRASAARHAGTGYDNNTVGSQKLKF